jgi:type IV secretion system protein VirD4
MIDVVPPLDIHVAAAALVGDALVRSWLPRVRATWSTPKELRDGPKIPMHLWNRPMNLNDAGLIPGRIYLGRDDRGRLRQARKNVHVGVFGPPQADYGGKTSSSLIPNILGWCGPLVQVTTKADIIDACRRARLLLGEVWFFDPLGRIDVSELPGVRVLHWSPVTGCEVWDTAVKRATTLTSRAGAGRDDEAQHWRDRTRQLLACLLHAAALDGKVMSDVWSWVHDGATRPVWKILRRWEAHRALKQFTSLIRTVPSKSSSADTSEDGSEAIEGAADSQVTINPKERNSVYSALQATLSPFDNEAVLHSADAAVRCDFSVREFLLGRRPDGSMVAHSLFVLNPNDDKDSDMSTLVVGLVSEIISTALELAAATPGRCLRNKVLFALDEVAHLCPLDSLPALLGQAGSSGLIFLLAFQELVQAETVWGKVFRETLPTLLSALVIYPGLKGEETLRALETMCGQETRVRRTVIRRRWALPWTGDVQMSPEDKSVWNPGRVREIADDRVLVIMDNRPAVLMEQTPWFRPDSWPFNVWAGTEEVSWGDRLGQPLADLDPAAAAAGSTWPLHMGANARSEPS